MVPSNARERPRLTLQAVSEARLRAIATKRRPYRVYSGTLEDPVSVHRHA
jgi:hypothetical protein